MHVTVEINELKNIVQKMVRDILEEELIKIRISLLPYVSDEEQKEIETLYGKPDTDVAKSITVEI